MLELLLSIGLGRAKATQIASTVGQILAVVFVVAVYNLTGELSLDAPGPRGVHLLRRTN